MTQWIENTELGRERGPAGLLRAWAELLVRPRQFFQTKVAPGDQAPGIIFAAAVVLVAEGSRVAVFDGGYPVVGGQPVLSAILWVLLATVLVAPAGLHLVAALQTVLLVATLENRAGVSETVQVICYALAPCAFAGVPSLWIQAAVALWGTGLLVAGVAAVHDVSPVTGLVVAAVPAVLVFGYGFGGVDAVLAAVDTLQVAVPL